MNIYHLTIFPKIIVYKVQVNNWLMSVSRVKLGHRPQNQVSTKFNITSRLITSALSRTCVCIMSKKHCFINFRH